MQSETQKLTQTGHPTCYVMRCHWGLGLMTRSYLSSHLLSHCSDVITCINALINGIISIYKKEGINASRL